MRKINISKNFLQKEYIKQKKSCFQISKIIGCSHDTIWRYLKK